jgi:hypothetical protein
MPQGAISTVGIIVVFVDLINVKFVSCKDELRVHRGAPGCVKTFRAAPCKLINRGYISNTGEFHSRLSFEITDR